MESNGTLHPAPPKRESKPSGLVSKGHIGSFADSGESSRHGPDGGEPMRYNDDRNGTDPKQTSNPPPDPTESAGPAGWKYALNSFLERAFLKADVDTGC